MFTSISYEKYIYLLNQKSVFTRFSVEKENKGVYISFDVISESDCINWSDRCGYITAENINDNLFDIFYSDDFQNDGAVCDYDSYSSVVELLENEDCSLLLKSDCYYISDGNIKDILLLPDGIYTVVQQS